MQASEFVFFDHNSIEIPLGDEVFVTKDEISFKPLVSNHSKMKAHITAPEIDLYIKNSEDDVLTKSQNVTKLFEARAICFDYAQDTDYSQEVGKNILLVGDKEMFTSLQASLKERGFAVIVVDPNSIAMIDGHLGALRVTIRHEDELHEVDADQIIWQNAPEFALRQSGVLNPNEIDIDAIIKEIEEKTGTHEYKNYITHDHTICQYHERQGDICGKCVEVCPTVAIVKMEDERHLKFSHIDCQGCGGCISVCPSGAIEYAQMPRLALYEIAKMYEDKIPLIIPRKMFADEFNTTLPKGVLPLAIEGEKYLHEAHYLSLLQESGSSIIFYSDFLSKGTKDSIYIINQAYQKIYGKDAIYIAMNEDELKEALTKVGAIEGSKHGINEDGLRKREIFSSRLSWMVGEKDYGVINSGEHVEYGEVKVNEVNCTLCLSCVGACNVRALTAHPEDNTLRFNASICTACGYCEYVCPEKDCLTLVRGEIKLNKDWFGQRVLAKDTLFECIMCGKPFATTKSVNKIAQMMLPVFAGDSSKEKSLYCCADCKPKMMFESYLTNKEKGMP